MKDEQKILIGKIVAPQGIRGEVRVQSFADKPTDFKTLSVVSNRFSSADFQFVRVVPNSNVVIAKIRGVDDRNAAETLRGTELFVERSALPDLQSENVFYQADLIGFEVVRDNKNIGTVVGFQNFGAGDIIELGDGSMVSFVGATVDVENKFIYVI
ncbi:MAG: 16S rRNA processing protein RimM [Alphaproteobacteria bacterium]|nr:16S rRNA processing protein RimM [Alphaproteobacteria bacterium]